MMKVGDLMKVKKFYLQKSECFDAAPTKMFLVVDVGGADMPNLMMLKEVKSGKVFRAIHYEEYWDKNNTRGKKESDDEHFQIKNCPTAVQEKWNKTTHWKRVSL